MQDDFVLPESSRAAGDISEGPSGVANVSEGSFSPSSRGLGLSALASSSSGSVGFHDEDGLGIVGDTGDRELGDSPFNFSYSTAQGLSYGTPSASSSPRRLRSQGYAMDVDDELADNTTGSSASRRLMRETGYRDSSNDADDGARRGRAMGFEYPEPDAESLALLSSTRPFTIDPALSGLPAPVGLAPAPASDTGATVASRTRASIRATSGRDHGSSGPATTTNSAAVSSRTRSSSRAAGSHRRGQ